MKIEKYHYVIGEDEILPMLEDTEYWEDFCCDQDGYSTVIDLERLKYMEDEDENVRKMIDGATKLINKLATQDNCKPSKIKLVVLR